MILSKYQVVSIASNTIHEIHIYILMTEFVKAVLKHFDFTTPKGLKSLQEMSKR